MSRWLRHLTTTRWAMRRCFPASVTDAIEAAIGDSERQHGAEICFAVETALEAGQLWRGLTARERALEVFGALRVWDTQANNGVLFYVLLAEHDIEIVADRAFNGKVSEADWAGVCESMRAAYRRGEYREGSVAAIRAVTELVKPFFPPDDARGDELGNRPRLL